MIDVKVLTGFDHCGDRKKGQVFSVSEPVSRDLARKGLVRVVLENPEKAAGAKSSVSPAAPASRKTTAKKSCAGKRRGKSEAS